MQRSGTEAINPNQAFKTKMGNKFLTLADLCKILTSGRHQTLSKRSSLSISSLCKLDEDANKFYFYQIALLILLDVTLNMLFNHTLTRK